MVQVNDTRINDKLAVTQHVIFETIPSDQVVCGVTCSLRKCQAEEERKLEVLSEPLHHRAIQRKVGNRCKIFGPSY